MKCSFELKANSSKNDLDLANPYGNVTCLILYLYSMELGSPPLYKEINRVIRYKDLRYLTMLGPYIKALNMVTTFAERNKYWHDKIHTGYSMQHAE